MADLNFWVVSSASLCFGPENNPSTVDLGLLGQVQRLVKRIVGFPETTLSVASTMDAAR